MTCAINEDMKVARLAVEEGNKVLVEALETQIELLGFFL